MTPYQQGKEAHQRGTKLTECPYFPGTLDWLQWREGWLDSERWQRK